MTTPETRWTAELGQPISHPPIAVGGTLLAATRPSGPAALHSDLQAFSATSGESRWQRHFEHALISGLAAGQLTAVNQATAVVATSSSNIMEGVGSLLAFDEDGEIIWRWPDEVQHFAAPVIVNQQIVVVADGKTLLVISPESGADQVVRVRLPASSSLSPPVIHDNVAYIPCRGPELMAVDLEGEERWHFQFQGSKRDWLDESPVIDGSRLFTVSSMGSVFALARETGKLLWQAAVGEGRPLSAPALQGTKLAVGFEGGVQVLDTQNGRPLWTFPTTRPVSASPRIVQDTLYFTSHDHFLYALDLESGQEKWRHELARRIEIPPVITPDALITGDRGGRMIALTVSHPAADLGTPTAGAAATDAERRETAQSYEDMGLLLDAAALRRDLGELERAAQLYESGADWLAAAEIWQQLDRYGKRAEALAQQARQVSAEEVDDEDKAKAWEQAARAFAETGQKEERQQCEREMARYRQQAILDITVEPESDLVMSAWTRLNFTVHNQGFGSARQLGVRLQEDDRFDGQVARTQTIISLAAGREYGHWLDIRPLAYGNKVPLQLIVEYRDKAGSVHEVTQLFYLEVAEDEELPATRPLASAKATDSLEILASIEAPDGRDLYAFRNQIVDHFNKDEMVDVLFQLQLREDDFDERLSAMVRELIVHLVQHGRFDELLAILRERRPAVEW